MLDRTTLCLSLHTKHTERGLRGRGVRPVVVLVLHRLERVLRRGLAILALALTLGEAASRCGGNLDLNLAGSTLRLRVAPVVVAVRTHRSSLLLGLLSVPILVADGRVALSLTLVLPLTLQALGLVLVLLGVALSLKLLLAAREVVGCLKLLLRS